MHSSKLYIQDPGRRSGSPEFHSCYPVALGVLQSDLAAMRKDPDEPFRTFAARVQDKAETWEFKVTFFGHC